MNEEKAKKIAVIALILSLLALSAGTNIISNFYTNTSYYICGNCTNGTNGSNGLNGINGINGSNGINGVDGVNGTNGINGTIGIGGGRTYYLDDDNTSNVSYSTYNLVTGIDEDNDTDYYNKTAINGYTLIANFTSTELNYTEIPIGTHILYLQAQKFSTGGSHHDWIIFNCSIVTQSGVISQNLGQSVLSSELLNPSTIYNLEIYNLMNENIFINYTDKLLLQIYSYQTGSGSNPTVQVIFNGHTGYSRLQLPLQEFTNEDIIRLSQNNDNDSKFVNKSGDTMTGVLNVYSSVYGGGINSLNIYNNYSTGGSVGVIQGLCPNIDSGGTCGFSLGQNPSTKNRGYTVFRYISSGSNLNNMAFGFFGGASELKYYPTGLLETKDIKLTNLSGSGTVALCVTSSGDVQRSTNTTSKYLTC